MPKRVEVAERYLYVREQPAGLVDCFLFPRSWWVSVLSPILTLLIVLAYLALDPLASASVPHLGRVFGCHLVAEFTGVPRPWSHTSLLKRVGHVVPVCTEKQVGWIDTGWIITSVTYEHSIGYSPEVNRPRKAVRSNQLAVGWPEAYYTVSGGAPLPGLASTNPLPTAIRFDDISPKSRDNIWPATHTSPPALVTGVI